MGRLVLWLISLLFFASYVYSQNQSTFSDCLPPALDWYTSRVGESPCMTYQRLRGICDPDYLVVSLNSSLPPDRCGDQVNSCCCNSVSFALSMLCLNCQTFDTNPSGSDPPIDAGPGTYEDYLAPTYGGTSCKALNRTLPDDIQTAVCNLGLHIMDPLYNLFWVNGDWYYQETMNLISEFNVVDEDIFTRCNFTSITPTLMPNAIATSTGPAQNPPSAVALTRGAIAGLVLGSMLISAGIATAIWVIRKRIGGTGLRFTWRNQTNRYNDENGSSRHSNTPLFHIHINRPISPRNPNHCDDRSTRSSTSIVSESTVRDYGKAYGKGSTYW